MINPSNTWKQDAYDKGALARREGRDNTDNPYSDLVNEELFDDWAEGWWDTDYELKGLKGECAS
jgi:hypothetical protein